MKKQNVRTLSLIVCTFTYLLIGAAVFDALESDTEKKRCEVLQDIETMIKRKYGITEDDYKVMETVVLKTEPHKAGKQWKFAGAFYYATTVLTTIGYGHSTPSTVGGKLFTMCYAMVGIPLGLVMFQSIGERVNSNEYMVRFDAHWQMEKLHSAKVVQPPRPYETYLNEIWVLGKRDTRKIQSAQMKFLRAVGLLKWWNYGKLGYFAINENLNKYIEKYQHMNLMEYHSKKLSSVVIRNVKQSLHCRQTNASELDLICVVTTLSSLTIAGGAAAFSKYEGWTYFDSVYYCFITLTTIGFGDMVALQKDNALDNKPEYVVFALIFILFGLAIVAASLNLLVLRFVTMNTEDERRDEAQAMQALQGAVRLEGDVITANGSILSGQIGHICTETTSINADTTSVCSCHCPCLSLRRRNSSRRSPAHIHQMLSALPMREMPPPGPHDSQMLPPALSVYPHHRASI